MCSHPLHHHLLVLSPQRATRVTTVPFALWPSLPRATTTRPARRTAPSAFGAGPDWRRRWQMCDSTRTTRSEPSRRNKGSARTGRRAAGRNDGHEGAVSQQSGERREREIECRDERHPSRGRQYAVSSRQPALLEPPRRSAVAAHRATPSLFLSHRTCSDHLQAAVAHISAELCLLFEKQKLKNTKISCQDSF